MTLIGISGKKKSGKTTVAEHIQSLYPDRTFILSFADALKDEVCEALGVNREFLEQNKDDFRLILQGWGTDLRRKHFGNDYWLRKYCTRLNNLPKNCIVITPDVRFVNEAETVLKVHGVLWRIELPAVVIKHREQDSHISENDLDRWTKWDSVINNNDTLDTLKQTINTILKNYKL